MPGVAALLNALLKLSPAGIVLALAIPGSAILVLSTLFTLTRQRSDRANDNVYTAAVRLAGVSVSILGAFCVVIVFNAAHKWSETVSLEFASANAMLDELPAMDPAQAQRLTASMHAYTVDVLANEIDRQPNASEDSVANREMRTMANIINTYADRQAARTDVAASLQRDFGRFEDQRAERLTNPVDVMDPSITIALITVGFMTLLIVGFYPAGTSTFAKWLQVITSGIVVVVIVSTPLVLESAPLYHKQHRQPMVAFLGRLDHPWK